MNTPYQKHSETSKEAANSASTKKAREQIFEVLNYRAARGATADELSQLLDIDQNTVAARLRGMQLDGVMIRTLVKRKTRYNRDAHVCVLSPYYSDEMGRAETKDKSEIEFIKEHNKDLVNALTGLKNELIDAYGKDYFYGEWPEIEEVLTRTQAA